MISPTLRSAVLLALSILCTPMASQAQDVPQPIDVRQICGAGQILDAPAGRAIAQGDVGTQVAILDFGLGADGRGYYRVQGGYIAVEDAPHFCVPPNEGAYRAPPNTCHLIAASRRILPEVNNFAREYHAFLPTMSVYRSSNGWHAISLGVVTVAAAEVLLENAQGLPADSYCADGADYIAAMDQRGGIFSDPEGSTDAGCLTGDAIACTARAEGFAASGDNFAALRFWMLGCMAGDYGACGRPLVLTSEYYDHPMLTAVPDMDYRLGVMRDLARTACDAGSVEGCVKLAGRELQFNTDALPEYLTALQALTAGCAGSDEYACRDMFRLMERREKAMGSPVPAEDWYQAAQLRADTCRHDPAAGDEFSCRPVYNAYAAFAATASAGDTRVAQARDYLRAACAGGNTDACPPPTVDDGFQDLALVCQTQESKEGADACSSALSYYARHISATDVGALVTALQAACTPTRIAGCETLAFVYGPHMLTGADLSFQGLDQPERRLSALQTGCRPGPMGQSNCRDLAQLYEERAEYLQARDAYSIACTTIRADSAAAPYTRGHTACFEAGLLALRRLNDPAQARSHFEFVCNDPDQTEARYACKHLGLMARDGSTMEKDDAKALGLFLRACFPENADRGDGEGCLLYADMLRENRDRISYAFDGDIPALGNAVADAPSRNTTDEYASHAYANGCISRWNAACQAGQSFNAQRLAAGGGLPAICQIRSPDGRIITDQTCTRIAFSETAEAEFDTRTLVTATVYVWPDGDRSLVQELEGGWRLNGAAADAVLTEDDMLCVTSHETGNSLCSTPVY